jgi:hypothetical protein
MQDSVTHVQAIIDGVDIIGLDKYRIQSPLFSFTLGRNNTLELPAQTITKAVSDGNWVFLAPLPMGKHVIYFKGGLKSIDATTSTSGSNTSYTFAGPYGWDSPVTYHLTIRKS